MSGSFSLSGSRNSSKSKTDPWAPQGAMLRDFLYPEIRDLYAKTQAPAINPLQNQAYNLGGSLLPLGLDVAQQFGQQGANLMGGLNTAAGFYGSGLTTDLQVPRFDWNLVNQSINNPLIDAQVAASLRDPFRQLTEQTLPGIGSAAVGTGNMGGSREAIAQGIAQRGFADRAADVSAALRGNAYDRGIGLALNQQGLGWDQAVQNRAAQTGFADRLADLGMQGMNFMRGGYDIGQGAARDVGGWGDYMQGLQFDQARFPWELLSMASNMIQAGNWGGTTKSTSTSVSAKGKVGF